MPFQRIPSLGFAEMFTHPEFLKTSIKHFAESHLTTLGTFDAEWDDDVLDQCIGQFREGCIDYYSDILDGAPSQLKYLGYLLYCLTQLEEENGDRNCSVYIVDFQFHEDIRPSLKRPEEAEEVICSFGNELLMFMAVFHILNQMQSVRSERKRYDVENPPMHYRFLRAVIDYLRPHSVEKLNYTKTPLDFYMILKTMDLFGVDCNYD